YRKPDATVCSPVLCTSHRSFSFFFTPPAATATYTLSLHDALPILSTLDTALLLAGVLAVSVYFDQDTEEERDIRSLAEALYRREDRKSTRLNSSHGSISYAVFCLKKKTKIKNTANIQYITQIVLLF